MEESEQFFIKQEFAQREMENELRERREEVN